VGSIDVDDCVDWVCMTLCRVYLEDDCVCIRDRDIINNADV
jgi:hypothetical protein